VAGAYCIDDVPPGSYDIECKVDDYLVAYVRDVVVEDTLVGADLDLIAPALRIRAWPNPASSRVSLDISTAVATRVRLEIFDSRGRYVRGWEGESSEHHQLIWNFLDRRGQPVPAGVYFARLSANGDRRVTRILRLP
jgi:hypothetical protein